jgi:biotin carboxyl carrier protein
MSPENKPLQKRFRVVLDGEEYDLTVDGEIVTDADEAICAVSQGGNGAMTLSGHGRVVVAFVEPREDDAGSGEVNVWIAGRKIPVRVKDERDLLMERYGLQTFERHGRHEVHAPMPGLVVRVLVEVGQEVRQGQGLIVLEAMKMENEIRAEAAGVVNRIHVTDGDAVTKNAILLEFET